MNYAWQNLYYGLLMVRACWMLNAFGIPFKLWPGNYPDVFWWEEVAIPHQLGTVSFSVN